jgi:phosphatidylserine/phosphatidylglycerophosphate/cardiolipin synthase-like enzyme
VRIVKEPVPLGEGCQLFPKYIINRNSKDVMPVKDPADCADEQALVRDVEAAAAKGSAYVPFNKKEFCTKPYTYCFEHGKIAVVNDRVALVSTGNFDSTNLCNLKYNPDRCNRAYTVVTSVPEVVGTLGAVFKNDLKGKYYDLAELLKSVGSPKVTVSPFSLDQLSAFIDSAKESIRIQNQYLKEPEINKALIRAAGRKGPNGKKVRIMVNVASPCSFGKPQGHEATSFATIYRSFDAGGISSRMFTDLQKIGGMPGYLHAKAIVVDDKRAWVGSINGSTTAVNKNREFGVFFDDTVAVRKLIGQMQEDFTSPNSESWQEGLMCTKDTPRQ